MAAYLIVDCEVTDAARYEGYKRLTPAAIAAHGGRFIVRRCQHEMNHLVKKRERLRFGYFLPVDCSHRHGCSQ